VKGRWQADVVTCKHAVTNHIPKDNNVITRSFRRLSEVAGGCQGNLLFAPSTSIALSLNIDTDTMSDIN
jgi:hypothetical protein